MAIVAIPINTFLLAVSVMPVSVAIARVSFRIGSAPILKPPSATTMQRKNGMTAKLNKS